MSLIFRGAPFYGLSGARWHRFYSILIRAEVKLRPGLLMPLKIDEKYSDRLCFTEFVCSRFLFGFFHEPVFHQLFEGASRRPDQLVHRPRGNAVDLRDFTLRQV